ncbi:MAG: LamG domain-containing protein, partial [Pirellulaceae bacterium]|nr:LamG domain-containing protein [Pirellulaceae bacterium]
GGTSTATGRLIVFNGNRGNELLAGTTLLPLRSWNHVVLVRQGDTVRVYLNGAREPEIEGRLPPTFPDHCGQIFVGARNERFAPFQGRIDQVAIYDRPLRPDEVAAHFAVSGTTGSGDESE